MMKTLRIALALVGTCLVAAVPAQTPGAFRVIGYYAEWTAPRFPVASIPGEKLTHVNYAFGKIGADNRLTYNTGLFESFAALKQRFPHLKVIMSVGGWTDSGPFYEMAATDA